MSRLQSVNIWLLLLFVLDFLNLHYQTFYCHICSFGLNYPIEKKKMSAWPPRVGVQLASPNDSCVDVAVT